MKAELGITLPGKQGLLEVRERGIIRCERWEREKWEEAEEIRKLFEKLPGILFQSRMVKHDRHGGNILERRVYYGSLEQGAGHTTGSQEKALESGGRRGKEKPGQNLSCGFHGKE